MTTSTINKRDEIIDYVETNYEGSRLGPEHEDITELVDDILAMIVADLDKKIKYCDKCMNEPTATMEEQSWFCWDTKKKAFEEVKTMLVKK